jgi:tetratricopeptide (TPR) repeat protein
VLGKEELYLFLLLLAMHELHAYRLTEVAKLVDFLDMAHDEIPPYSVMSHYLLGRYYLLNGQYSPASHEFSTVLGLHGSVMRDAWRVDIMNNLLLVFVFGNELHSAERTVKKLVQLPSGSEWEEYALGYYYMKKKEFDKALKSFLQAKELHFAPSMLGIVECCYLAGWHEKMRDYYHILNEIAPGSFFEKIANMFLLVPGHDLIPLKDYVTHILQPQFRLFGFYYYKHTAVTYLQEYFRTISRYKQVDLLRLEK